ncbi:AraC family transcriptional regulator [Rhodocytophaga aerolata]|uniref:AraC family transcriptional regulator n=1 Tax=Rhodocytophaga aerolata TaxID=455078 RepID=A0ABT8R6Y2_9BACT|nr:AraC family transcriptional regulator [Rhodocytophaga aerolata]MDO1446517.1 AraC family transcriptional regulator [Rhodocytophaga aerolata]
MKTFRRYFKFADDKLDNSLSVIIHTLGYHIHPANTPYPDANHPESHYFSWEKGRRLKEYQILYICKGEGAFEATGMPPQTIEAGTVILLYPGTWHRYKPLLSSGWEEYWVGFSGSFAKHLLEQECFNPQNPIIKVGFNTEFLATFEKLLDVVEIREESYQKLASFLLIQLLGILYSSVLLSNQKFSRKEKIVGEIKKAITDNWQQAIDFEKLANTHGVSYAWLRKTFKEITGTSLNQYHLSIKLRKAEQLIYETDSTLSEIAYACGFESVHYFSRMYKSKMHTTPSELRKIN